MNALVLPPAVKSIGLSTLGKRKPQGLLEAAQHNRRHPDGRGWLHKSDPAKIHLNQCLHGPESTEGVVALQEAMMASVGYTPKRKDYSQAFELLFTTPTEFTVGYSVYFEWCLAWTQANLGQGIVLSADTHFDEGTDDKAPHLHILMAPIVGGEWVGNSFVTTKTWPKLQVKFGRDLEAAFNLKMMPQLTGKALTEAATAVKERLTELLAPHIGPDVLQALLKLAGRKPAGLVGPLGINGGTGGDGGAAFRRTALSTGKGGKREKWSKPNGIESNAYGIEIDRKKAIPFLCSGFAETPPPNQHTADVDKPLTDTPNADGEIAPPARPAPAPPALTAAETFVETTTRHRDCDLTSDRYDLSSGDFIPAKPPVPRLMRQAAEGWVTAALTARPTRFDRHAPH